MTFVYFIDIAIYCISPQTSDASRAAGQQGGWKMKPCRARRAKCLSIIFLGYKVKYVLISSYCHAHPDSQAEAETVAEGEAEAEAEAVILIMIILTLISVANLCTIWLIDWRCLHCKWQRSTQTAQNLRTHTPVHTHTHTHTHVK